MAHGEALGNIDEGADEEACEMQQTLLQTKVGLRSVQQTNEHIASVMEVDSAIDKEQAEANETSHQSTCPIGRRIRNPFGFQCAMVLSAGGAFGDQCQIQYDNGQTDELHAMHCAEDDRCPQPTTGPASVEPVHHQTTNYGDADMESALSDCPHGRTVSLESWVSHTRCATIVERASSEPPTCLIRFDDGHTMRLGPSDMGLSDDCPQPTMTTTTTPIPPFFSPNSCALPGSTAWCSPCNLQGGCMNRFTCTEHNFSPHRDYNCCADGMADCDEALHGGATWTSMLQRSEEGRQVQPSDDGFATW